MTSHLRKAVLAGVLIGMVGAGVEGATLIWRGGWLDEGGGLHGDGATWSNPDNWELDGQMGVRAPQNGDDLVFPILDSAVTTNYTLYNDLENLAPASLTFRGSGYNLQGNTLRLGGPAITLITTDLINLENLGASRYQVITLTLGIELTDTLTIWTDHTRSNGRLQIGGPISGPYGIVKTGPTEWTDPNEPLPTSPVLGGRVRMGVSDVHTYTGDTVIQVGRLEATVANALPYGEGKGNVVVEGAVFGFNPPTGAVVNINALVGSGTVDKFDAGAKILTLGNANASGEFSGVLQESQRTQPTRAPGRLVINKIGTGTQIFNGSGTLSHQVNVNQGTLVINATIGHLDFYAPGLEWSEVERGDNDWTVAAGAMLAGTGSITLGDRMVVQGTLKPGTPSGPGTLDVTAEQLGPRTTGDPPTPVPVAYLLSAGSTLMIDLGGTEPGDGSGYYSQLNLLAATVDESYYQYLEEGANLAVNLVDGFVPQAGDIFYILTRADTNPFTTTFAGLPEGATLTVGGVELTITYQANWTGSQASSSLTGGNDVALYIPGLLGDTNNDGVVDLADYNNVVNNLGATGGPNLLGDTNKDGVVDLADYNNVVNNLGATRGASLAVPEPATVGLLAVVGLMTLGRRRVA